MIVFAGGRGPWGASRVAARVSLHRFVRSDLTWYERLAAWAEALVLPWRRGWVLAVLVLGGPACAQTADGYALAVQQRCVACHRVDSRGGLGPPFKAIAQRFAGQAHVADYLAGVIRRGSSGQWGAIPMPAQDRVSPEDALALARWILSLDAAPASK